MSSTFYMFKHIFKMYSWAGKELPFILLAVLALFDGALQFVVLGEFFEHYLFMKTRKIEPHIDRGEPEGTAIKVNKCKTEFRYINPINVRLTSHQH